MHLSSTRHLEKCLHGCALIIFFLVVAGVVYRVTPPEPRLTLHLGDDCRPVGFSPDGSMLATALEGGFSRRKGPIRLWDVETGQERCAIEPAWENISAIEFSPNSKFLAATDQEGGLKVFDAFTGQELAHRHLETKFGNYLSVHFTPDGAFLAFNDYADWPDTEVIKFWDPVAQQDLGTMPGWHWSLRFSPDGRRAVTWDRDNNAGTTTVMLWNLSDRPGYPTLLAKHTLHVNHIAVSPDLSVFAVGKNTDVTRHRTEIKLCDLVTATELAATSFQDHETHLQSLKFTPTGRMLLGVAGGGSQLDWHWRHTIWDTDKGLAELGSFVEGPILSRNDKCLLIPTLDGAESHDPETMQKWADLHRAGDQGPGRSFSYNLQVFYPLIECSPDGRIAVVSHLEFDTDRGRLTQWINDHIWNLPSRSSRGTRIWSTKSGRELATLPSWMEAHFSPDGRTLVAVESGGILSLWDMPPRPPVLAVVGASAAIWLAVVVPTWLWLVWWRRKAARRGTYG